MFRRTKEAWAHHLVEQAFGSDRTPGTVRTVTEQAVRLTKKEAQQLTDELTDLVEVWRKRNQGGQDDGRRTYIVFQVIEPFPDHDPGASD